jgi:hypothetical protein
MKNKQTAVEWFIEQLDNLEYEYDVEGISILDFDKRKIQIETQAKQMEKEQIIEAYTECWMNDGGNGFHKVKEAESYYNETYGQTKN